MVDTRISKLLGIKNPIFQGGMAWVSSATLVGPVSNTDRDITEGPIMAGQISGLLEREETCEEIFKSIAADYFKVFERLEGFRPVRPN